MLSIGVGLRSMRTIIDHFERREIEGAQLLRHERPVLRLGDVRVGGEARDQDIGLLLGVEQMADVTGVHEVEHAVAHDDLLGARARSDGGTELINGLDLAPIVRQQPVCSIVVSLRAQGFEPGFRRLLDRVRIPQRRVAPIVDLGHHAAPRPSRTARAASSRGRV